MISFSFIVIFLVTAFSAFPGANLLDGLHQVRKSSSLSIMYQLIFQGNFLDKQYHENELNDYFESLIQKGYNDFGNFIQTYLHQYE